MQVCIPEAGPVGKDAATLQRTADEEGDGSGAMVGAVTAVDPCSTAKFGQQYNNAAVPRLAHIGLDRGNCSVKRAEQVGEPTLCGTFVDMRVPVVERQRRHSRPIGPGEEFRRHAGRLDEKGRT